MHDTCRIQRDTFEDTCTYLEPYLRGSRPGRSPASEYTPNPRYGSPTPLLGSEISEAPWQTPRHWRSHCTGTQLTSDRIPMRSCWTSSEPIEYMYMYFTRIPNESKIHFGIHIRYIKIHVSWALPWCHTGYVSGYIRIRVSWTLHHETSYDTCTSAIRIHRDTKSRYMYLGCVMTMYVSEMQDTFGIHSGYMRDTCICKGDQDTCGIHPRYMKHDEIHVSRCVCIGSETLFR